MRPACLPVLLVMSSRVFAQDVAIFKTKTLGPYDQAVEAFRAECRREAAVFDMKGDDDLGLALVEQIRAGKPKVILAVGTKAARIAKEKLPDVPVVFCMVFNPDKSGVLGPNTTGVVLQIPYSRQFTNVKTLIPEVKWVGVLYDPAKTEDNVELASQEASWIGMTLLPAVVHSQAEVPEALRELLCKGIDLLWLTTDPTVLNKDTFASIITTTLEGKVPVMAYQSSFVKAGAFMALVPSYSGIGRQAGRMANSILAGTRVSDTSLEPPNEARLSLNMKVARQIGIRSRLIGLPPDVQRFGSDSDMLDEHGLPLPLFQGDVWPP